MYDFDSDRLTVVDRVKSALSADDFAEEVRSGLSANPKTLPCRYFYDETGSKLFEEICELPEYYLTRAETNILKRYADDIVSGLPSDLTLVELGSGSATKTRLLIDALIKRRDVLRFTPIDISRSALEESSENLLETYDDLEIVAVAAEYADGIAALKEHNEGPELILWLGSSIGNLSRDEASSFLVDLSKQMSSEDRLLVGIDLRKPASVLEPAYADSAGVTAQFNRNVLSRVNAELGGHFDLGAFEHLTRYDEEEGRVEMHLVSEEEQAVEIDALDLEVAFEPGETIHTENSYKYSQTEIETLTASAGLVIDGQWFDSEERFSLNLLSLSERRAPSF